MPENSISNPAVDQKLLDEVGKSFLTEDEKNLKYFAGSYHRLLEHHEQRSELGLLSSTGIDDYKLLLKALRKISDGNDSTDLNNFKSFAPKGNVKKPRVIINPRAGSFNFGSSHSPNSYDVSQIIFRDSEKTKSDLLKLLSVQNASTVVEMLEVYAMAMLRDVPFSQYKNNEIVALAIRAMNDLKEHFIWTFDEQGDPVTAEKRFLRESNFFRGPTDGDREGDYLSVFLTARRPPLFPSGCAPHVTNIINAGQFAFKGTYLETLYRNENLEPDFLKTEAGFALVQNGGIEDARDGSEKTGYDDNYFDRTGPIKTGRHLGDYVHIDNVFEEYIRAVDILTGAQVRRDPGSPYNGKSNAGPRYKYEGDGPTLGPPDIWAVLGAVRAEAERAAFAQKWFVARRARPETFAGLIHLALVVGNSEIKEMLHPKLRGDSEPINEFFAAYKDWNEGNKGCGLLLPQMYPEGAPGHPSWPSGHATVAGACVTVIKAFFDDEASFQPIFEDDDSSKAVYNVGRELDKLASNISLGRNFGGVHYRSDGEHGVLLGEEIAIQYLNRELPRYLESKNGLSLSFERRDSQRMSVPTSGGSALSYQPLSGGTKRNEFSEERDTVRKSLL